MAHQQISLKLGISSVQSLREAIPILTSISSKARKSTNAATEQNAIVPSLRAALQPCRNKRKLWFLVLSCFMLFERKQMRAGEMAQQLRVFAAGN